MSIEKKVEEILREHLGKENQIKAREIADMIESTENDRTVYSKTRKIITGLIEEGYPIGSSNKGYFWLETKEELEETIIQELALEKDDFEVINGDPELYVPS